MELAVAWGPEDALRVGLASDHAGFSMKQALVAFLAPSTRLRVSDFGPPSADRVDYPDYAQRVAAAIQEGTLDAGILVCGSGIGMGMAANRFSKVRAVVALSSDQVRLARAHNDANVLCLGERMVGPGLAETLVETFFAGTFEGGRHVGRVAKLAELSSSA